MLLLVPAKAVNRGFMLIELSIVLVIVALLVGGVLVGRDMIHAAELRSVLSDIDKYKTAVNTFLVKYNCVPGDCATATNFWGVDPNGCPNTANNTVPKTATCNGNGNGTISSGWANNASPYNCEEYRFWQQLANAGLVAGQYVGAKARTIGLNCEIDGHLISRSVPGSKISGSMWWITYYSTSDVVNWSSPIPAGNVNKNFIILAGSNGGFPSGAPSVRKTPIISIPRLTMAIHGQAV